MAHTIFGERVLGVLIWIPFILLLPIGFIRTLKTVPRYLRAASM